MDLQAGDRITILIEGRLSLTTVAYVHRGSPTFKLKNNLLDHVKLEDEGIVWRRGWDLSENDRLALLSAHALSEPPF